jgi:hypothetical protein
MCWTRYMQTSTNNVNKTWALIQTTKGKDEQNIVFMRKLWLTPQHGTQNVKTHNKHLFSPRYSWERKKRSLGVKQQSLTTTPLLSVCKLMALEWHGRKKPRLPQIKDHAMNRVNNTFCTVTWHHIQHIIAHKDILRDFVYWHFPYTRN